MRLFVGVLAGTVLTCSCNTNAGKHDEALQMAAEIHNKMVSTKDSLELTLLNLKKDTSGLVQQDSILAWEELLKIWENDLVEVPGNESHHDHHQNESNHHHSHQQLEVTPKQMLEVQKELQQRLIAIEKRIAPSGKN